MTDEQRKILTQFCKEARTKCFASYADEGSALHMYQKAENILDFGAPQDKLSILVARIQSYRKTHQSRICFAI